MCKSDAAGHTQSYAYEALVSGVEWPSDVDPRAREIYMSPAIFERTLGISFAQYSKLPSWRKMELKREFKLF
jgi:hypothetical protein